MQAFSGARGLALEGLETTWARMHYHDNGSDDRGVGEHDGGDVNCDGDGRGCVGNDGDIHVCRHFSRRASETSHDDDDTHVCNTTTMMTTMMMILMITAIVARMTTTTTTMDMMMMTTMMMVMMIMMMMTTMMMMMTMMINVTGSDRTPALLRLSQNGYGGLVRLSQSCWLAAHPPVPR